MNKTLLLSLLGWGLLSCSTNFSLEKEFFKENASTRLERLDKYSLEKQYKIFLYGNQVIHPPAKILANPIAKKGQQAIEYVLEQLKTSNNDLDFRDSLVIFDAVQRGDYYDICSDSRVIKTIRANNLKVKNLDWRKVYNQILEGLC